MSVMVDFKKEAHIFVKGASEMVLSTCDSWFNMEKNEIQPISAEVRTEMNNAITKMAESSLRTLCLAYKKLSDKDNL